MDGVGNGTASTKDSPFEGQQLGHVLETVYTCSGDIRGLKRTSTQGEIEWEMHQDHRITSELSYRVSSSSSAMVGAHNL